MHWPMAERTTINLLLRTFLRVVLRVVSFDVVLGSKVSSLLSAFLIFSPQLLTK